MTTIARLRKLTSLHVTPNNEITDDALDALCQLPNLRHLDVGSTRLTDRSVEKFSRLKGLASLDLYYTPLSNDAIKQIKVALPNCQITPPRR